jgi:hypothetical protein
MKIIKRAVALMDEDTGFVRVVFEMDIEEFEKKIAPQSSASFLD